jgi:hypothetical protein
VAVAGVNPQKGGGDGEDAVVPKGVNDRLARRRDQVARLVVDAHAQSGEKQAQQSRASPSRGVLGCIGSDRRVFHRMRVANGVHRAKRPVRR